VSRAWVGRSRIHLCETMKITRPKLIFSNLSYLTPLCGYAKTHHFTWPGVGADPSSILDCFEQSKPQNLAIHSCEPLDLNLQTIRRYFAKFPCTSITTLEFHDISPTDRVFLVLSSLFPNADDLSVSVYRCGPGPAQLGDSEIEIVRRTSPPHFGGSLNSSTPLVTGFGGSNEVNSSVPSRYFNS
jgi:hypothetical protein